MRIAFFGDSLTSGVPGCSYVALLRTLLPGDVLINYGKGNDSVVSLKRRVARLQLDAPLDVACLWVGVNDVLRRDGWPFRAFNTLLGQRRARDLAEFRTCYVAALDRIGAYAPRVIVAPPVLKGEIVANPCNGRLALLAEAIRAMAAERERVEFLDLRSIFVNALAVRPTTDYVSRNPFRVVMDAGRLRTAEEVDRAAAARGLHLTLDGVHLNSAGARLAAEAFAAAIRPSGQVAG